MKKGLYFFALLMLINSCIEPFDPGIESYDNILVVDAFLSTDVPAAKVKLARSYPYNGNVQGVEKDAWVTVMDEDGNLTELTEQYGGIYQSAADFVPVSGKNYKIHIIANDGSEYESVWQMLNIAPEIDDLWYEIERRSSSGNTSDGVNIFLNSEDNEDLSRYYKWEWDETWTIIPPINLYGISPCYQQASSNALIIHTTENYISNSVTDQKIMFVSSVDSRLSVRYSVNMKQYSLTRDNFAFLEKLKKINDGSGGFFDPIPAALLGNINNLTNPEEPVLGFFSASTFSSKRIFIDRSELPFYVETGFGDCESQVIRIGEYNNGVLNNWFYVYRYFDSVVNDTMVLMTNLPKCFDCSFVAPKIKPNYWVESQDEK